jgi:hypothetical protein
MVVTAAEAAEIDTILEFCGFQSQRRTRRTQVVCRHPVIDREGHVLGALAKEFAKGTPLQGRIVFGLHRTNLLKGAIHWAQDFQRISRNVTLEAVLNPGF